MHVLDAASWTWTNAPIQLECSRMQPPSQNGPGRARDGGEWHHVSAVALPSLARFTLSRRVSGRDVRSIDKASTMHRDPPSACA